jgi:hypothetical protein
LLGVSIFLLGTVCFIGTTNYAGGQDKDKKPDDKKVVDKKTDDKKTDDKKPEVKKTDDKKPEPKADEKKKDEPKKEEPKVEPKTGGDTLPFKAFDPKGKPFYQEQTTTTKQKIKVQGQEVTQDQTQTFIVQWTPKEMSGTDYVVAQKIVGVKMSIDIGGNKITYDSTAKNPKNPMTDFFEQLMKQELIFTISPDLKVKKIDGRTAFIKALADINPQMKGLLDAILSDDALIKMAEPTWWAYPKGGVVSPGLTWKENSKLDLGPIGTYDTNFDFTYKGKEKELDKIDIKTKLSYSAPTKKEGLPFIIQSATLTSNNGTGEALYDRAKGRFQKTKLEMKLKGDLKIEVGNMTTNVELNQSQDATTITHDENPWADKK